MGRITSGPNPWGVRASSYTYGDSAHVHAVTSVIDPQLVGSVSAYSAAYDPAGNTTCRDMAVGGKTPTMANCAAGSTSGARLSYDVEGRLAAWQNLPTDPTATDSFLYDGHGNRVEQVATQNGTTSTTIYVGSLEQIVTTGATTTTTTYYSAGTARIALAVNGTFGYLASDGLGSATVALNAGGSATASVLYAPYGTVQYTNGTMPTDYGFTGQHADAATGLDHYNARYYDPVAGQFTSADTILQGSGYDIFGLSRYAYAEGNPEVRTDPSGHRGNILCEGSKDIVLSREQNAGTQPRRPDRASPVSHGIRE
jgi:RHS repeat-associated protein